MAIPSFETYLGSLGRMTAHIDPNTVTPASTSIKLAASSLAALDDINIDIVAVWVKAHPDWVPVLGLTVGLSQEKLKNSLRHAFDSSSWMAIARDTPEALVEYLDHDFDLIASLTLQRFQTFDFGDVLVARAGTRSSAIRAGASGRLIEDQIEAVALDLGLQYETRTRFTGRNNRTAPCDLVIPVGSNAEIVVAAKGFDSTGSKLTDAVREIEEMADVRLSKQVVFAVIDGIGWKSRQADLKRIWTLWETNQIDGMYTIATLGSFRADLEDAARLRKLLPAN